jgi:branched-chain amino acid transport system ATP-binding protein
MKIAGRLGKVTDRQDVGEHEAINQVLGGPIAALSCEGLSAGYGDIVVLRDVSMSVRAGTVRVVLGRNGAGKTTLASTLAGLLPVSKGHISFDGTDITHLSTHARSRLGIQLVQEGKRVFRQRTVEANLALGGFGMRTSKETRRERIEEVYALFPSLANFGRRRAGELSGGQQQMLAIGQALMARPKILILDEPSAGLSPIMVDAVFESIAKLRADRIAIILYEQMVERALEVADEVTVLDEGHVVIDGTAAEVNKEDIVRDVYFGRRA